MRKPAKRTRRIGIARGSLRGLLLAVGAGTAMGLALPGPGLAPLVLLVPGLLRRALRGAAGWRAFGVGWLAGFAQWVIAVPWIYIVLHRYGHLAPPLAVLAVALMAAILACTWALASWGASWAPARWWPWLLPTSLAAVEVLQGLPPWHFPWNPVASVVAPWPVVLTPLPVIGAAGLSWLILLLGGGLDALLDRAAAASGVAIMGVSLVASVAAFVAAPRFSGGGAPVEVAALQPNVPLEERWDMDNEAEIEKRVWSLNASAAAAHARWLVWPESAVPRSVERDGAYRSEIERFARQRAVWLLVGSIGTGPDDEYFNSVYSFAPSGELPFRYDKVHLVPFGEYVPLVGRLAFLRPLVREVGGFTPGTKLMPLPSPLGPAGIAVCYEIAFPSLIWAEVERGAKVLATITNDGWYGNSAAPRQHLALAILRAAEARRWVVRAANTGISAIIDPYGEVVSRLGFGQQGFITADVVPGQELTPAVRGGWWLRLAPVAFALGAIILAVCGRGRSGGAARGVRVDMRGTDA